MKLFAIFLMGVVALTGCSLLSSVPDDQLAADLQAGSQKIVQYGLAALMKKYPDKVDEIKKDAVLVDTVLKTVAIPNFSGATTGDVAKAALNTIVAQLNGKVSPEVLSIVQGAIDLASPYLPANPTDKLSDRTKKAVLGVLNGMSLGIEASLQ